MLDGIRERLRTEDPGGDWQVEQAARWSKRLLLAELDMASTRTERENAAERHRERVIDVGRSLHAASRVNVGRLALAAANYHVAEASEILACIRAGKPLPSTSD